MSNEFNDKAFCQFENEINEKLSGDTLKSALDFATFLRANDLSPERLGPYEWNIGDIAYVNYDGDKNDIVIVLHYIKYDGSDPDDDDLKEFTWAHVVLCPGLRQAYIL